MEILKNFYNDLKRIKKNFELEKNNTSELSNIDGKNKFKCIENLKLNQFDFPEFIKINDDNFSLNNFVSIIQNNLFNFIKYLNPLIDNKDSEETKQNILNNEYNQNTNLPNNLIAEIPNEVNSNMPKKGNDLINLTEIKKQIPENENNQNTTLQNNTNAEVPELISKLPVTIEKLPINPKEEEDNQKLVEKYNQTNEELNKLNILLEKINIDIQEKMKDIESSIQSKEKKTTEKNKKLEQIKIDSKNNEKNNLNITKTNVLKKINELKELSLKLSQQINIKKLLIV